MCNQDEESELLLVQRVVTQSRFETKGQVEDDDDDEQQHDEEDVGDQEDDDPSLAQIQKAMAKLLDKLKEVGKDMNSTMSTSWVAGEKAMEGVSSYLDRAASQAKIVSIFGNEGKSVVDTISDAGKAVKAEIEKFHGKSSSFQESVVDAVGHILKTIAEKANETLEELEIAGAAIDAVKDGSGNASLVQLQASVSGLQRALHAGCLTGHRAKAILHLHGQDAMEKHLKALDVDGDGCIKYEEWTRAEQLVASDAVALLMVRAAGGPSHTAAAASASLDTTLARKSSETKEDPCSVATSALESANSSIEALESELASINATMEKLIEQGLDLLEDALKAINTTMQSGIETIADIGLPHRLLDPAESAVSKMLELSATAITSIQDAETSVSASVARPFAALTSAITSYMTVIAAKLADACGTSSSK